MVNKVNILYHYLQGLGYISGGVGFQPSTVGVGLILGFIYP